MASKKKKILLVDDEVGLTKLIKLNLEGTGQYIVQVENLGTAALEVARAFRPDMIFLDVVMPDIEGSEVAALLRQDPLLSKVPVVFLTATVMADEVDQRDGMIGGQTFLAKPASIEQIIECIKKHVG